MARALEQDKTIFVNCSLIICAYDEKSTSVVLCNFMKRGWDIYHKSELLVQQLREIFYYARENSESQWIKARRADSIS